MSIQAERSWGPIITIVAAIVSAAVVGALILIRGDGSGDTTDEARQTPPAETR